MSMSVGYWLGLLYAADPFAFWALLLGGLAPLAVPLQVGAGLYWLSWWVLLGCMVYSAAVRRPLGVLPGLLSAGQAVVSGGRPVGERLRDAAREVARPVPGARPAPAVTWVGERRPAEQDERAVLERLEEELSSRILGQEHVHRALAQSLRRRAAGLSDRRRPLSALFAGPTGTGKTETAKVLAALLGRPLLIYDMSSYQAPHDVAGLVGAPPGYIGSDRPGRLVSDISRNPNAVVLMDEIEKAYPSVFDVLLPALDEGRVREQSQGLAADCSECIWIFTSNLLSRHEWVEDPAQVRRLLLEAVGQMSAAQAWGAQFRLRPEFANRIEVVAMFRPLPPAVVDRIAAAEVLRLVRRAASGHGLRPEVDRAVVDLVMRRADRRFGARDVRRAAEELLGGPLADAVLRAPRGGSVLRVRASGDRVEVVVE
jgi:ATP-dependent Clp protease ATP-binding subunit ClpA